MKISKMGRSRFHRGVWFCYGAKGGKAALRETGLRRLRNLNGIAFNTKTNSYWIEVRNYKRSF